MPRVRASSRHCRTRWAKARTCPRRHRPGYCVRSSSNSSVAFMFGRPSSRRHTSGQTSANACCRWICRLANSWRRRSHRCSISGSNCGTDGRFSVTAGGAGIGATFGGRGGSNCRATKASRRTTLWIRRRYRGFASSASGGFLRPAKRQRDWPRTRRDSAPPDWTHRASHRRRARPDDSASRVFPREVAADQARYQPRAVCT
jgi:hypothetical protein